MLDMTVRQIKDRAEEFIAQHRVLGLPDESELAGSDNVVHVESYTRSDGTEVKAHWRSKPNSGSSNNEKSLPSKENNEDGTSTGGAARIDRDKEPKNIEDLPKNNDEFFEKERNNPQSWLMRKNAEKNVNNPDAKLFMDIALVNPKNVQSTQDYQFVSSENVKKLNERYNLTGNKEIPNHYDGFEFSADSPTAKALNSSEELKNEIFNETKNYNPQTGTFKSDKLEIEFKNDKNLQYSFGHMTILNPKLKDGFVTGMGYDTYDFDAMYGKNFKNVSKETKNLNNSAYALQSSGHLNNYYILVPLKVKI
jgi:hypothetical protein